MMFLLSIQKIFQNQARTFGINIAGKIIFSKSNFCLARRESFVVKNNRQPKFFEFFGKIFHAISMCGHRAINIVRHSDDDGARFFVGNKYFQIGEKFARRYRFVRKTKIFNRVGEASFARAVVERDIIIFHQ